MSRSWSWPRDMACLKSWSLEAYRDGLVAFSRTQDYRAQLSVFCSGPGRAELLVTYDDPIGGHNGFRETFSRIGALSFLSHTISRSAIRLIEESSRISLHIPMTDRQLEDLQNDSDPNGMLSVGPNEPRAYWGYVSERISLSNLNSSVRLVRRNCIH